jgi:hypothetical protein
MYCNQRIGIRCSREANPLLKPGKYFIFQSERKHKISYLPESTYAMRHGRRGFHSAHFSPCNSISGLESAAPVKQIRCSNPVNILFFNLKENIRFHISPNHPKQCATGGADSIPRILPPVTQSADWNPLLPGSESAA